MSAIRTTLPPSFSACAGMGALLDSCGAELDRLEAGGTALCRRAAAATADGPGLTRWERELSLPAGGELDPEARRAAVLAALDFFTTRTPARVRARLEEMTGGTAVLTEQFDQGAVLAAVTVAGRVPPDVRGVQNALRRATPAHLRCALTVEASMTGAPGGGRLLHGSVCLFITE